MPLHGSGTEAPMTQGERRLPPLQQIITKRLAKELILLIGQTDEYFAINRANGFGHFPLRVCISACPNMIKRREETLRPFPQCLRSAQRNFPCDGKRCRASYFQGLARIGMCCTGTEPKRQFMQLCEVEMVKQRASLMSNMVMARRKLS